jgi:hypothetical protein
MRFDKAILIFTVSLFGLVSQSSGSGGEVTPSPNASPDFNSSTRTDVRQQDGCILSPVGQSYSATVVWEGFTSMTKVVPYLDVASKKNYIGSGAAAVLVNNFFDKKTNASLVGASVSGRYGCPLPFLQVKASGETLHRASIPPTSMGASNSTITKTTTDSL